MFRNRKRLFALAAVAMALSAPKVEAAGNLAGQSRAVVKLYVTNQRWNPHQPWTKTGVSKVTCTGFIVKEGILTNAHCIADAAFIEIELQGFPNKPEAYVVSVNHQIDLALVQLTDPSAIKAIPPITLGDMPKHRDKVVTVGYPMGGQQVSYTEGVVSRIDVMGFAHSNLPALLVQTDAAINPGNSGGPVFSEKTGKCIGVATQKNTNAEAQGFFVPTPMIEQFFADRKDGTIDGIPNLGIAFQNLENDALRDSLKLKPGQTGVRVTKIARGSSADGQLQIDDVLLEIQGAQIFNDGRVEFAHGPKISLGYHVYSKTVGDVIRLKISRAGEVKTLALELKPYVYAVIPHMPAYDRQPDYFFKGGLIFQAVEPRLVGTPYGGRSFPNALLPYWEMPLGTDDLEELVVISSVYDAGINKGYGNELRYVRVMAINGTPILKLADVGTAFSAAADAKYLTIELENGQRVVLDQAAVAEVDPKIRKIYNIPER